MQVWCLQACSARLPRRLASRNDAEQQCAREMWRPTAFRAGPYDRGGSESGREPRPWDLERDDFSSNRHLALIYCWSMIPRVEPEGMLFSENRYPPRIKSGAGFFGIML